jgi:phosphoglycerate dehydrogenase-like enzyme
LLLNLCRGVLAWHQAVVADPIAGWQPETPPPVRRLSGMRLGIVGLGRIGTAVALRAKAFGIEPIIFDPYVPSGQELAVGAARVDTLHTLLGRVDAVTLHVPLTAETRSMFDLRAFRAMRPGSLFINTARGQVFDIDALAEVLEDGHLAGAGLDVLPEEPPRSGHRLLTALREGAPWLRGRLILTPHKAWKCVASLDDLRRLSVETVLSYLVHGRLKNCVNQAFLATPRVS